MTQSFDEWFVSYDNLQCNRDACKDAYKSGAASRQVVINETQNTLESLTKDYQELTEMYIQQGINLYKHQSLIKEALDFAKEAHSDLNIGMLKMVYILKGENDEEVD